MLAKRRDDASERTSTPPLRPVLLASRLILTRTRSQCQRNRESHCKSILCWFRAYVGHRHTMKRVYRPQDLAAETISLARAIRPVARIRAVGPGQQSHRATLRRGRLQPHRSQNGECFPPWVPQPASLWTIDDEQRPLEVSRPRAEAGTAQVDGVLGRQAVDPTLLELESFAER